MSAWPFLVDKPAVTVAPDVAAIVRPIGFSFDGLRVVDRRDDLDTALAAAAETARAGVPNADVIAAVRTMYRRIGIDPTKTRPSSEALLRRVRRGEPLPRVNTLVDVINWCSLESQLPFGLYDRDRIEGALEVRLGRAAEEYAGIRRDTIHVAGRLVVADRSGPFGNPTADSARTMITLDATRALVVIFAPGSLPEDLTGQVLAVTEERIARYCR
jgi:DNA/RNA-binding domain of Phe-tRNA-synthetase-like protein